MSTSDNDTELTIALAEYAHISELRNQLDQKSSTRFSFFLALSTAVTAVVAALLSQFPNDSRLLDATAVLGLMLLVFGVSIFLRQVAFTSYSRRLTVAQDAIRVYFAGRAPGLKPYLLLPVGADRGAFPHRTSPVGGFAAAIGVLNSTILALLIAVWTGLMIVAAVAFVGVFLVHLAYVQRSRTASAQQLAQIRQERSLSG